MIYRAGEKRTTSAVLFDFDGTLVDTADRWQIAYDTCLSVTGRCLDGALQRSLVGASVADAADMLGVPRSKLDDALLEAFMARPVVEMPGATELVIELAGATRLAVASNAPEALVRIGLTQLGILDCVDAVLSAETTGIYKPLPDVYLRAASEVGVRPATCIAVEDSVVGGRAAVAAGMRVVFVSEDVCAPPGIALHVRGLKDPAVRGFIRAAKGPAGPLPRDVVSEAP